ncbi:hypothetical protein MTATph1_CDS0146 [Moorella phage MTATph1]
MKHQHPSREVLAVIGVFCRLNNVRRDIRSSGSQILKGSVFVAYFGYG